MRSQRRLASFRWVGDQALVATGSARGERARVRLRPDRHLIASTKLELAPVDRRDEGELLLGSVLDEELCDPVELDVRVRVCAQAKGRAVQGHDQGLRDDSAVDPQELPGPKLERVARDQLSKALHAGIRHPARGIADDPISSSLPSARSSSSPESPARRGRACWRKASNGLSSSWRRAGARRRSSRSSAFCAESESCGTRRP